MTREPASLPAMPAGVSPTSFAVEFDLAGLLDKLGIDCGAPEDQEGVFAAEQAALAASPEPPVEVPGRVAGLLRTGPGLAAWLASASIGQCPDTELPDVALGYRRLAAWAQAHELSAVAEMASRTAIRRDRADTAGRPYQVLPEAGAEVALGLTMSQLTAMDWAGLGTQLRWRLPATAAALTAGQIDLARAKIIAEATAPLPDETARAVEERVLAVAEGQTSGQLRAAVRRAVIAADPDGAERRRQRAERCAKVSLYPDHDGTATLAGTCLPGVSAAGAMARISAIARAMKSAGHPGGLDYLRAYVMLGLLTGTLPLIPPAPGAPPDEPPDAPLGNDEPPGNDKPPDEPTGPWQVPPPPSEPPVPGLDEPEPPESDPDTADPDTADPDTADPDTADPDTADPDTADPDTADPDDDHSIDLTGPVTWPPLPAGLPAPTPATRPGCPPQGLLDVLLPWSALTGSRDAQPAVVGRIGPVTPVQTRQLLALATQHPATEWRVILTDEDGHAQAVERLRRRSYSAVQTRAGPPATAPVIGRITVTIPRTALADPDPPRSKLAMTLVRAAVRAAAKAQPADAANEAAGGCAHLGATAAYRPVPRLREFVIARDGTCTFPPCGQPAWRADLDHTVPWHIGGLTCSCNLSARCRTHHKIKALAGWRLEQPQPDTLRWTTPAGRTYTVRPNQYPI